MYSRQLFASVSERVRQRQLPGYPMLVVAFVFAWLTTSATSVFHGHGVENLGCEARLRAQEEELLTLDLFTGMGINSNSYPEQARWIFFGCCDANVGSVQQQQRLTTLHRVGRGSCSKPPWRLPTKARAPFFLYMHSARTQEENAASVTARCCRAISRLNSLMFPFPRDR